MTDIPKIGRITAEKFYSDFIKALNQKKQSCNLSDKWFSNTFWTNMILNNEYSILRQVASDNNLKFLAEKWRIDALLCNMDNESAVSNEQPLKEVAFTKKHDYLSNAEVAVEVENFFVTFMEDEIYKLSLINCPLKVGITYIDRADEKFIEPAKRRVKTILNQRFSFYPEQPANEYLIIIVRGPENIECLKWIYRYTMGKYYEISS